MFVRAFLVTENFKNRTHREIILNDFAREYSMASPRNIVHNRRLFLCKRLYNNRAFYFKYVEKKTYYFTRAFYHDFCYVQFSAFWSSVINGVHLVIQVDVTEN